MSSSESSRSVLAGVVGGWAVLAGAPGEASTPTLTWSDAAAVGVYCVVDAPSGFDRTVLTRRLCDRVRTLAAKSSPLPVSVIEPGDPALLRQGVVTLIVHGAVQPAASAVPGASGHVLAFTVRPWRAVAETTASPLTGSSPRLVPVTAQGHGGAALDRAVSLSLAEVTPWSQLTSPGLRARPLND